MSREGSADGFKTGSLIRRLEPVRLANVNDTVNGNELSGTPTLSADITGLTSGLTVHLAVALCTNRGTNANPIKASAYPAVPGTMQLTPVVLNPQAPPAWLRPVFQDPTATDNGNHPLGQNIPYGWSFVSEGADMIRVDVDIAVVNYAATLIRGTLICFATIEYTGPWWDPKAVELALGQVRMVQTSDPQKIGSY